jgi:hypothetical protein
MFEVQFCLVRHVSYICTRHQEWSSKEAVTDICLNTPLFQFFAVLYPLRIDPRILEIQAELICLETLLVEEPW